MFILNKIYKDSLPADRGYSYLEEQKYGKKTTFLKGFYKGNKPNY